MCDKTKQQPLGWHFFYVVVILLIVSTAVIGFLLTDKDAPFLYKVLGYISTITSIMLSIIAIFITVISNNSTNGLLHTIRDIADEVKKIPETVVKIPDSVGEAVKELNDSKKGITDSLESISGINKDVRDIKSNIDIKFGELDKKIVKLDKMQDIIDEISCISKNMKQSLTKIDGFEDIISKKLEQNPELKRIGKIESLLLTNKDSTSPDKSKKDEIISENKDFNPKTYFENQSYAGVFMIYTMVKAFKNNKAVSFFSISELLDISETDYIQGYFCGMVYSSTLYSIKMDESITTFKINNIDKNIIDSIDEALSETTTYLLSISDENNESDKKIKDLCNNYKELIDELIENSKSIEEVDF